MIDARVFCWEVHSYLPCTFNYKIIELQHVPVTMVAIMLSQDSVGNLILSDLCVGQKNAQGNQRGREGVAGRVPYLEMGSFQPILFGLWGFIISLIFIVAIFYDLSGPGPGWALRWPVGAWAWAWPVRPVPCQETGYMPRPTEEFGSLLA